MAMSKWWESLGVVRCEYCPRCGWILALVVAVAVGLVTYALPCADGAALRASLALCTG